MARKSTRKRILEEAPDYFAISLLPNVALTIQTQPAQGEGVSDYEVSGPPKQLEILRGLAGGSVSLRGFVSPVHARPRTWCTATPCLFPRRRTADLAHHVWHRSTP